MFLAVQGFGIVMREGVTRGDSCSLHRDRVGQVDELGPKGVTSCLGNVTATREVEQTGERGGEILSYTLCDGDWRNLNQRISLVLLCLFCFGR